MTTTRPTQPAHGVILGYCVKQGAGTSGIVDVKVDNGLELAELHDVLLTGASTGDVLALASDGLWKKRTLGSAAAAATTDFAPAAQGVSNGNGHNHDGGDGAQIAYSSLSGTPTLGGAAALNVGTTAGTVAAGDAPAGAIAALKAEANPLPQYLQPAEIIAGTNMSVDTTTTPGSAILNATGGSGSPGGTTGQMQFNNAGAFAGVAGSSVDPATGNTTFSARWIQSTNSAASAPASTLTGTWFTGGTTTTTKPHYLIEPAGTTSTSWSTAGTGFGVNAPSGFAGDLLWLGVNGTRTISINSALGITTNISGGANIAFTNANTGQDYFTLNTSQVILRRDMLLAWSNSGTTATADDLRLLRDAAHTLAQRSGSNAQTSRIYNTFTSGTNFERLNLRWTTNEAIIDTEAGSGGGTLRGLKIGSASTSLLGFYGATPAVQGVAVANATDAASVITQLNALLARVRTLGLIAT
jgi:hypothetical protein